MCGIVAFIGKPLDRQVSFDLTSSLLVKTEIRGDDAAGFWASDTLPDDQEGCVLFSKAPVKSREFVQSEAWKTLRNTDVNLLVSHCRKSTVKGSENKNRNNHPFLSTDSRSALVHNGNVPEYDSLSRGYDHQKGYNTLSDCDSEILLRMMERGPRYDNAFLRRQLGELKSDGDKKIKDCADGEVPLWSHSLLGLVDIFARINYGAMACAIGERWEDGTRALWLFRDRERPLQVIDMRNTLNQIYIVSEKRIWREAVETTPTAKRFVKGSTPIIEFPPMYIWLLTYNEDAKNQDKKFGVRKFRINRQRRHDTTFEQERPDDLIEPPARKPIKLVTNLTSSDESDWKEKVKVVVPGEPQVEKKGAQTATEVVEAINARNHPNSPSRARSATTTTRGPLSPDPTGRSADFGAGLTSDDWPSTCFSFMYRFLVSCFDTLPGEPQLSNLIQAHHLRETAYHSSNPIPDPAIPTAKFDYSDFQQWAELLNKRNQWGERIRKLGVAKGERIPLWIALREARQAWIENLMQCAKQPESKIVDEDAYLFIAKYMRTVTEKGHRPMLDENQGYDKVYASQIKAAVEMARKENDGRPLPELTNQTAVFNSKDYQEISQRLQVDNKWKAHCRRNNGVDLCLWLLLQEAHEGWRAMMQAKANTPASIRDEEYRLVDVGPAKPPESPVSRPLFEEDEEPNPGVTDHEVERPLGSPNIRTEPMTPRKPLSPPATSSEGDVDVALADRYNEVMQKIRATIMSIDQKVTAALKSHTITSESLEDLVSRLQETADDLVSSEFAADKIGDDDAAAV